MKTNKKKSSTARKLLPAVAMLAVSAVSLSSATYAWFTMNKEVSVKSMQVKAKAEGGLLINEIAAWDDTSWDDEATANSLPGTALIPTSTTNGVKWFHANSKKANDEAGATLNTADKNLTSAGYEELSLTPKTTAASTGTQAENSIYYVDGNSDSDYTDNSTDKAYYVMYKYYLKASNDSGLTLSRDANAQNVAISEVKATLPASAKSADLDKALRVGIKMGGKMYIYAPVYGTGSTSDAYYACTSVKNTPASGETPASQSITNTEVLPFATNAKTYTALTTLPGIKGYASGDNAGKGEEVDIYIWFEGEDDYCQSDKITDSLDDIVVDVKFSLETIGGTAPTAITKNEF